MTTLWGDRRPGAGVAVGEDELGGYVLYGEPDRVRTPPELGGHEFRVASVERGACVCQVAHESKTYRLIGTELRVTDCAHRGFLWWKPRA